MQKKTLIPTPLIPPEERRRVTIVMARRSHLLRIVQIFAFFLGTLWIWVAIRVVPSLRKGRYRPAATAQRLREFAERMGGLWVKLCQLIAMRRDLFSRQFCDEVSQLQDRAHGFSPAAARRLIEHELKGPVEQFFSEFNLHPFAAASIGQTHEAKLRATGQRIAIKVQRPGIDTSFRSDFGYVRFLARILMALDVMPHVRLGEALWELEKALAEELDYRLEATSITRMRKTLKQHHIYVPKVYLAYSTRRVLVMEFVEGVFMSDYIKCASTDPERLQVWLKENNVKPKKVGMRLYMTHGRQVFEDNMFHCDLHPGNILLLRNSKLVFIDFGSVGSFEKSKLEKYRMFFTAMTEGNYAKMIDLFLLMSPSLPSKDLSEAKNEVIRLFREWESRAPVKSLSYHEKSVSQALSGVARIFNRYGISTSWEFLRVNRAMLTIDASLMFLMPNANFVKMGRRYEQRSQLRAYRESQRARSMSRRVASAAAALEAPAKWAENLYFDGEWLRKRAANYDGTISKAADVAKAVFSLLGTLVLGFGAFCVALYINRHHSEIQSLRGTWLHYIMQHSPHLSPGSWLLVGLWLLFTVWRIFRIRQHLGEKDFQAPGRS